MHSEEVDRLGGGVITTVVMVQYFVLAPKSALTR